MASAALAAVREEPGSLITRNGQMQWAGLLFGPDTPFQIASEGLTGWEDLPGLDSGDAPRPTAHGSWAGGLLAQARTVTAQVWLAPQAGAEDHEIRSVLQQLRRATMVSDTEQWLAVRLYGETLACRARVLQRVVPADRQFARYGIAKATIQWTAVDPRRYEAAEQSAETGLPQGESGLVWPLAWPLVWGSGASGDLVADNAGSAPAHPVITLTGPCSGPRLTVAETGATLAYDIELAAGDRLVIDTAEGTVLLNGSAERNYTALPGSHPEQAFTLPAGSTAVAFRAAEGGPAASASLRWRTAHW
ncbi:phage distal tail protein [Yinghuangia soli]|uniref:Phage tail family protein n=1 Tax=Yinghuangia soli TaxID=2908204 RepID=A0AA41U3G3_9ACTN|nr:phage tail domain-containing protein [Yinghuangia soli]MCF2532723.1 phage tail family protein [Yinghuangia soli]